MTRHAELLASPVVGQHVPVLLDAERVIADPVVRNRGTVGGSVCQADPSEDLSGAFCALRASAVIRGEDGERTVPMREFFTGPYQTVVAPARDPGRAAGAAAGRPAAPTSRSTGGPGTGRSPRPAAVAADSPTGGSPRPASG